MSVRFQTVLSAVVLLAAASSALAQASGATSAAQSGTLSAPVPAASAASASAPVAPLVYRSMFDGYRPFSEPPVVSWREANDLVGRIGGWQAYARESQGGPAADHDGMPMNPAAPSKPAPMPPAASASGPSPAPASTAGGHSGHKTP